MRLRQSRGVRAFISLTTALTLIVTAFGVSTVLLAPINATAAQTVPYKVNFQGRLTDNSGNILTDGLYNIKFRMFDALTVGTNKFQEDRIMTATDNRIQVTNGLFNIQFGDVTALSPALFSGVFPLFLEVELPTPATATCATNGCAVFTEGAMTPRQPLASSPYAFNADTVDGLDAAALVQLSPAGQQTGNINVSGTISTASTINGATLSGGTLTSTAVNSLNVSAGAIAVVAAATSLTVNAGTTGTVSVGGVSTGDILLGGGSGSTGCTVTNVSGNFGCTGTINGATITGGTLSGTAVNSLNVSAGAISVVAVATALTIDAGTTGTVSIGATSTGDIMLGGGSGSTGCSVTNASGNLACSGTITGTTLNGTTGINTGAGAGTQRIDTTGNLVAIGNITGAGAVTLSSTTSALTLTSGSGTIIVGSGTIQRAAAGLTLDVNNAAASTLTVTNSNASFLADLNVEGGVTIGTGQVITVGATPGVSTTCSGGQLLQNQVTLGGITTGGSCVAAGGGGDLQSAYTSSTSPATMNLNTSAKNFVINANDLAVDPNILFNLQCVTCSAGDGRFAVQDNGVDVFTVNPVGSVVVAPLSGQNLTVNLPAASGVRISSATAPTVEQVTIDNTASTGVTTVGADGLGVNFKGGAAAIEASGIRVDFAPGTTAGGTWSGLRIVAGATGAIAGVTEYGLKLEGPGTPGAGTEVGAFLGTGWDIGIDVQSGGLQLAAQTDPAAPTANNLRIYAKDVAGRIVPKWVGPSGVDTPFQASLGFNRTSYCSPAGGAVLTTFISCTGTTFTNTGTANNPTPASTNLFTSTRRATFSTGTAAGSLATHRQSVSQVWRGNAAGLGGFFYTTRFGTEALVAGNRAFVGMDDSTALPTNIDPTTTTAPGKLGMAINANTGNWNFVNNVSGTAPTVTALSASFPVNTTSLYELVLYSPPNGTAVGWRVTNISTGAVTSGSASANIPTNTTFLAPKFWISNNATAAAAILDFSGWYLESDN